MKYLHGAKFFFRILQSLNFWRNFPCWEQCVIPPNHWPDKIQLTPSYFISLRCLLILFFHLPLYYPSDLFLYAKVIWAYFLFPYYSQSATWPWHPIHPYCFYRIQFGKQYKSWNCFLCNSFQGPVNYFLFSKWKHQLDATNVSIYFT